MSDTPRTDERAFVWTALTPREGRNMVGADFARELERENTELRKLCQRAITHGLNGADGYDAHEACAVGEEMRQLLTKKSPPA